MHLHVSTKFISTAQQNYVGRDKIFEFLINKSRKEIFSVRFMLHHLQRIGTPSVDGK